MTVKTYKVTTKNNICEGYNKEEDTFEVMAINEEIARKIAWAETGSDNIIVEEVK